MTRQKRGGYCRVIVAIPFGGRFPPPVAHPRSLAQIKAGWESLAIKGNLRGIIDRDCAAPMTKGDRLRVAGAPPLIPSRTPFPMDGVRGPRPTL